MYNIRDWCISRQLWWGHRVPAWHCGDCKGITVAREVPTTCSQCGSAKIEQDTDVLDTWFSSGLWPFSTLGWPDDTADMRAFYPTTLLVTGFDIIFFWAARMIMLGMEMTGEVPFRQVHIHGLVRDAERQKMSKMKGNVIDPLVINEKYGTDAVRFGLLVAAAPGNDITLSEEVMARGRNFASKIWNASRLLFSRSAAGPGEPSSWHDRWIRIKLNECSGKANAAFEHHRYHEAADAIWTFFWDEFCDWYLEFKKEDQDWSYAFKVYESALRLLHPLMPFVTEELWHRLGAGNQSIALARYPLFDEQLQDPEALRTIRRVQNEIEDFRNLRKYRDQPLDVRYQLKDESYEQLGVYRKFIERRAKVTILEMTQGASLDHRHTNAPPDHERLRKKNEELEKVIASSKRQLGSDFAGKAPANVVEAMRAKLAEYEALLAENRAALGE